MPFNIGPGELILILLIALVVLGPSKLPEVASSLGKSVREFRKAASEVSDAGKLEAPAAPTAPAAEAQTVPPPAAAAPVAAVAPAPSAAPAEPAEPARDPDRP